MDPLPADPFEERVDVGSPEWVREESDRILDALADMPSLSSLWLALATLDPAELRMLVFDSVIDSYQERDDFAVWIARGPLLPD